MRLLNSKVFGQMVRYHRKQSGLTQEELGRMAGLGKTVVFDIEKVKLNVKLNTLLKLFEVLNIQIDFQSPLMQHFEEELNEES